MFEIILTTTEYFNGKPVRTESATFARRYKSRQTAERRATEMRKVVTVKGIPIKCITTAEVRHV
ncbi:TPA: hypothetical protein R3998_004503 [Salmonella enterica subsp. enterica serovar Muenchen]|nr:hypothetical protein [Salmonella enterica subsp. enterica serovar Muenchen]